MLKGVDTLASVAMVVALAACQPSSEPQFLILPKALTCADCRIVALAGTVGGDTLHSSEGRIRLFGVDTKSAAVLQRGGRQALRACLRAVLGGQELMAGKCFMPVPTPDIVLTLCLSEKCWVGP